MYLVCHTLDREKRVAERDKHLLVEIRSTSTGRWRIESGSQSSFDWASVGHLLGSTQITSILYSLNMTESEQAFSFLRNEFRS